MRQALQLLKTIQAINTNQDVSHLSTLVFELPKLSYVY